MADRVSALQIKHVSAQQWLGEPVRRSLRLNPDLRPSITEVAQNRKTNLAGRNDPKTAESNTRHSPDRKRRNENLSLPESKRRRTSREPAVEIPSHEVVEPVEHWVQYSHWPKRVWSQAEMDRYLPRKKSVTTLRRKRSGDDLDASSTGSPSTNTPSDQKSRERKSAQYRDQRYEILLTTKGSFMNKDPIGITDDSKAYCRTLIETPQPLPSDTLFRDDLFDRTCQAIQNRNESRIIFDISQLLVPPAESLAIQGDKELEILIQSVNDGWNNSIPFTQTRPQPDYAVGFRREAFTEDQLRKIEPFVGDIFTDLSLFLGTAYLYFPFFTCEVKCGAAALDIADRQNAHSMVLAVRGVVELFRLVGREKELDRQLLAFSVSHDQRSVRIYGHYAVISGQQQIYYRHPIHDFSFTALDGKEKWTAYKFTKNMYKIWMPAHFKRLCSAIDAIPANLDFEVSQSELHFSEPSGLSQGIADHDLSESDADGATTTDRTSQSEPIAPLEGTPDTSFTQVSGQIKSKRHKKKA